MALVLVVGGCKTADVAPRATVTQPQASVAAPPPPPVEVPPPQPVGPRQIRAALLVPLSGPSAALGAGLLNAAQLALFEIAGDNFVLTPLDTKGTPEGASTAAGLAVAQKADIILGPVFAPEVRAAAPVAQQAGISMLSFSTDQSVAGNGVFLLGFLPKTQVDSVVRYARSQGVATFSALGRSDDYGRSVVDAARAAVPAAGGTLAVTDFYEPATSDFTAYAKRMPKPVQGATQGVVIADSGERLRNIASTLAYFDMDQDHGVRYLGTMLWDDPRITSDTTLLGAWYPLPAAAQHADFENRYQRAYNVKPQRTFSLGYDAAALAAVLARRAQPDFTAQALTNPSGFGGVEGIFRLLPDGTNQRGYAIMEITRNGPKEVSPAPDSFERMGY